MDITWLHASDLYISLYGDTKGGGEEGADILSAPPELCSLPVCEVTCMDAVQMYKVMGAWCLPWDRVPKAHFCKLWENLPDNLIMLLVNEYHYFQEELSHPNWVRNMFARDDVEMYTAVLDSDNGHPHLDPSLAAMAVDHIEIKCLLHASRHFNWSFMDWHYFFENCARRRCNKSALTVMAMLKVKTTRPIPIDLNDTCIYEIYQWFGRLGYTDCILFLFNQGYPDRYACATAAEYGQLECLTYLHEHGCSWDATTYHYAVKNGHLACVKYACDHGCPWDDRVMVQAVHANQYECMVYLHEHGCPWGICKCRRAAIHEHYECLDYMRDNGCPGKEETFSKQQREEQRTLTSG